MSAAAGEVVAMPTVQFEFDQYELTGETRQSLDNAAACLKQAPQVQVVVEGHADDRGTQEYNLALGEKRANAVKSYLKNLGIGNDRLRTRSKGENEPVCHDGSEGCWAQNRRVQFFQSSK
jgi:peptidoglycan-associated lipoprotein